MALDASWVTAFVAVFGIGSTLTLSILDRRASAARERRQLEREEAKEKSDHRRAQRALERESVMRLSEVFLTTRQFADQDPDEFSDAFDWDENFPESWRPKYYAIMRDSEIVSDEAFRDIFQDCAQAIYWCGGLTQIAGAGSGQRIARDNASLGFVVAGSWLREEAIGEDSAKRVKQVHTLLSDYDEMWKARQLKSHGEEPD